MYSLYLLFNAYLARFHAFLTNYFLYSYWNLLIYLSISFFCDQGAIIAPWSL